jgi:hypothetical protein
MPNEFIVKNGLIVGGNVVTSGTITINGALAATQSWVASQGYLTSASLSGYATQSYVTSAISALVDSAPAALDTLNELAAALGDDANFSTTITNSIASKLSLAGGTLTGALLMGSGVTAAGNNQPTALSYGLLQGFGTFTLAADTDGSQSEFAIITAGYGVASATAANGLAIGFNTLTWKNNTVWHAGNLTNLNQLTNGPGYITSYTETDTLASVTGRGATTTNAITVGALTASRLILTNGDNLTWGGAYGAGIPTIVGYNAGSGGSLYFYPNGSTSGEKMRLDPSGNLGIGTTNPKQTLVVEGVLATKPSSVDGYYSYLKSNWNENDAFELGISENGYSGTFHKLITSSNYYFGSTLQFWTADAERIRINASGNVGIGTTSPTSRLHVYDNSDVWHTRIGGASGELRIGGQTPSGAVIQAYTPGGSVRQLYLQRDGGNVGIGTDSPTATLQINGGGGDSAPTLRLISAASDTFNWASDTRYANLTAGESSIHLIGKANSQYNQAYFGYRHVADGSASNMLTLGLYASDYLLNILGNGNVGIGTTSPVANLSVVGTVNLGAQASGFYNTNSVLHIAKSGVAQITFEDYQVTAGIAVAASVMSFGNQVSDATYRFKYNNTYNGNFASTGTTLVQFNPTTSYISTGNFGIGTTTPTSPLEITNTGSAGGGYSMYSSGYSAGKLWGMRKYGIDNGQGIHWSSDVQFSSTWYSAIRIGHGQNATNPSFQSYYTTYLATTGGNVGIGVTTPQKKLDVNGTGIVASFGSTISPGQFAGLHFGYSESGSNNDSYKKSSLVFERTDNNNQGANASGKIHFLLNNAINTSANSLNDSVVTIDSDANGTVGSVRMGIGTRNPSSALEVIGTIRNKNASANSNYSQLSTTEATLTLSTYSINTGSYPANIIFSPASTEAMRINTAGKVSIGTTDTNSDKSDFTVYTGGNTSIALAGNLFRVGESDINWDIALRQNGTLQTYGQALNLSTQAGNYAVNVQPNGTTVAQFYQDYSYFPGLDFSISRVNGTHSSNYFRGDGSHLVIGTGGTLHLNYGNTSGNTYISGSTYVNSNLVWHQGNLTNLNQLTNGPGYIAAGSTISDTGSWTNATKFKSSGDISFTGAGNHSLQIFSDTNNDAFIAFHISGDHAVYFGLDDASNRLHTGGWSDGANKYQLWDTRDFTSTNISNWSTAYSWGNHASAGYLTSASLSGYATTSYVTTQINNLINGAPGALDTLSELATALGNDASFATTVTNSIATKLPLAGGTMSGTISFVNDIGTALQGTIGINDFWRIYANSTSSNAGYLEIATSDDGTEPIYVRQYTGVFSSLTRTATLLDGAGNTSFPGNLNIGGFLTESSSLKLKENVETSEGNLEKVVNLRPVTYNKIGSQTTELGLIAEEVAEVYPEFVQYDENGEPIGVNYSRLTAALIGAVKELTNQVQELNKKING